MSQAFSELQATLNLDSSGVDEGVSNAERSLGSLKTAMGGASVAAGALAAGGLAKSISAASSFESQMADVQKVTSEGTAGQLEEDIKGLSEEIPLAKKEMATLAEQAGKFGVEGSENIKGFVETVGQIQTATDLAAEDAGKRFAKIAGAVGLPMSEIDKLGNATNKLADSMKTDAGEITDTATRAANTLSQQLGLGKDTVLALSASMNEVSPSARKAAGSLRRAATALMDPKKSKKVAGALGMTADEFRSMRDESPEKLLNKVASAMNENGSKATKLRGILGKAATAFSKVGKQQDATAEATQAVNEQFENGTSLQKEMGIRTDTVAGQFQLLKNTISNVGVTIGNAFLPIIKQVVSFLRPTISRVGEFVSGLSQMQLVIGTIVPTISALVGGGALLASKMGHLGPAINAVKLAFSGLLGPVGLAVTAIGLLGTAFATNFGGIRDVTMEVVNVLRGQFLQVWTQLKTTILPILSQIANAWNTQGSRVESVAGGLIQQLGGKLLPMIQRLGARATQVISWIASMWSTHGSTILSTISLISTNLSEMLIQGMAAVRSALQGDFTQMRGSFMQFKTAALNIWNAIWPTLKGAVVAGLTAAVSWIAGPGVAKAKAALGTLSTKALAAFSFAKSKIVPVIQRGLGLAWTWVRTEGVALASAAFFTLADKAMAALDFAKSKILPPIRSALGGVWGWVKTKGAALAGTAFGILKTAVGKAFTFTKNNFLPPIRTALGKVWTWLRTSGPGLAKAAFSTLVSKALQAWKFTRQNVVPPLKTALGKVWTWLRTSGPGAAKAAVSTLVSKTIGAFEFTKSDLLPKIQGGLSKTWTWVKGPGKEAAKGALSTLSTKSKKGLAFAKNDLLPKIQSGLSGVWQWAKGPGAQTSKKAFQTLGKITRKGLSKLKLKQKFTTAIGNAVSWVKANGLAKFEAAFRAVGRGTMGAITAYLNRLPGLYDTAITGISSWLRNNGQRVIRQAFYVIGRGIRTAILALVSGPALALSAIESVIGGMVNWLTSGGATKLKNAFISIGSGIVNYVRHRLGDDLIGAIQFVIKGIYNGFKGLYQGIIGGSLIPKMFREIVSAAQSFGSRIIGWVTSLVSQWLGKFRTFGSNVVGWLSSLVGQFMSSVQSLGSNIIGWVTSLVGQWIGKFQSFGSDLLGWLGSLAGQFIGGLRSLGSDALGWAGSMVDGLLGKFTDMGGKFLDAGKGLIGGVIKGVKDKADELKDKVGDIMGGVRDKLPFSPAKEGPLSDLDKTGPALVHEFASGIKMNTGELARASRQAAAAAKPQPGDGTASVTPTAAGAGTGTAAGQQVDVGVTLSVDGDDELARLIEDHVDVRIEEERKDIEANRVK